MHTQTSGSQPVSSWRTSFTVLATALFLVGACGDSNDATGTGGSSAGGGGSIQGGNSGSGGSGSGGSAGPGEQGGSGGSAGSGGAGDQGGSGGSGGRAGSGGQAGGPAGSGGRVGGSGGRGGTGGSVTGGAGSGGATGGSSGGSTGGVTGGATGGSVGGATGGATGGSAGQAGSGGTASGGTGGQAGKGGSTGGTGGAGGAAGAPGTAGATGTPGNYAPGNPPVRSSGCGKTPTLKSGLQTIQSNGKSRKYYIRIPDNYDNSKPYRLIFGNHWMGGKAEDVDTGQTVTRDVWAYFGLKKLDTEKTAIFVAPDGNVCGTWCKDDEKFITDLVNLFKSDLCIDESRVFATGFSYGAIFSYSLACDLPGTFRAVATLAAAQNIGCSNGKTPTAYFSEVGMSDTMCRPELGRACRDTFVATNGCTKPASVPEWKSSDGKTHICYSYEGCKTGYPVRWCTGNYPHIAAPNDQTTGDNGNTTWVPGETWKFFTQF